MLPWLILAKPLIAFTSVVLPAPLGPIRPTTSPRSIEKLTEASAVNPE